jgi:hypothetical protein
VIAKRCQAIVSNDRQKYLIIAVSSDSEASKAWDQFRGVLDAIPGQGRDGLAKIFEAYSKR